MTMMVQASTDDVPEMLDVIERRRALGIDTFDEWWDGVYRIVNVPAPEHGRLTTKLAALLDTRPEPRGLHVAQPVNIGVARLDNRVPDLAVYRPDTRRTSRAFLSTAELVVEILSPRERAGEKLPFYAMSGVREYLEVGQSRRDARLLTHADDGWQAVDASAVIDLTVAEVTALVRATLA